MAKDIFDSLTRSVQQVKYSVQNASHGGTFARTCTVLKKLGDLVLELEEGGGIEKAWFEQAIAGFNNPVIGILKKGYSVRESGAYMYHRNFMTFFREVNRKACLATLPSLIKAYRQAQRAAKKPADKKWFALRIQKLKQIESEASIIESCRE